MLEVLTLNGTILKTPAEVTWALQDLSSPDSGRTLDGVMHKDRVAQKVKLTCKWSAMPASVASILLKNVNSSVNFPLKYFDVMENDWATKTFYVGDRTAKIAYLMENGSRVIENVSFDFIEV